MQRLSIPPLSNWTSLFDRNQFTFHSLDGLYWIDQACYLFSAQDHQNILDATQTIHQLCLSLIEIVIDRQDYRWFSIPSWVHPFIEASWKRRDPSLYGRFDLCFDPSDRSIFFYEYNADTPTSIIETGLAQSLWFDAHQAQNTLNSNYLLANTLDSDLRSRFQELSQHPSLSHRNLHFLVDSRLEDVENVRYLQSLASPFFSTYLHLLDDLRCDDSSIYLHNQPQPFHSSCDAFFKLMPWEYWADDGLEPLFNFPSMIEPSWKMLLSNKGLWAALWHYFPDHPYLLPTFLSPDPFITGSYSHHSYVKKPIFSREGANIERYHGDHCLEYVDGPYGREGFVYQIEKPLPRFNNYSTLIGSWVVGDKPSGIMIREDLTSITKNTAFFIPSLIDPYKKT